MLHLQRWHKLFYAKTTHTQTLANEHVKTKDSLRNARRAANNQPANILYEKIHTHTTQQSTAQKMHT